MKKTYLLLALIALCFASCKKDELDSKSIFVDPEVKTDTYTYEFDQWLNTYFTKRYNVEYIYKLDDAAMDPNYNVVPVRLGMADTVAHLSLYLWYDVYDKIVGKDFLTTYGPKMIQLVGSSMINAAQGTEKLGYAEGGIKITLMKINAMKTNDTEMMNEYIFKTMHHEFSHILHQQKTYPKDFESITPQDYDPSGWQYRYDETTKDMWLREKPAWKLGFVTCYGSSETHEDFVETIANYITKSDAQWQLMLDSAGVDGAKYITTKLTMAREWLAEKYNYDLDAMHREVQIRQKYLPSDYDQVMQCNFDYRTYPDYKPEN
ncbi:MAG: putative zinc-binding metallopeptidase [Paludibacteraceae bacterium]|nr:putative zinc-binding metallopeptidase [Paludibacteraceae bacterium]